MRMRRQPHFGPGPSRPKPVAEHDGQSFTPRGSAGPAPPASHQPPTCASPDLGFSIGLLDHGPPNSGLTQSPWAAYCHPPCSGLNGLRARLLKASARPPPPPRRWPPPGERCVPPDTWPAVSRRFRPFDERFPAGHGRNLPTARVGHDAADREALGSCPGRTFNGRASGRGYLSARGGPTGRLPARRNDVAARGPRGLRDHAKIRPRWRTRRTGLR